MSDDPQVVWHPAAVSPQERETRFRQRGCVVWFTGLSGSGKSTLANAVDRLLFEQGAHSYVLDGDNVRHGLNATPAILTPRHGAEFARRFGLGFSAEDREENIRRIGAVAQLLADAGLIVLTAFVSPYRRDRDLVRGLFPPGRFLEALVDTPLADCEARDPKGLYQKARAGEIKHFTGIDDPYEPPLAPELKLDTTSASAAVLAQQVVDALRSAGHLG